MDCSGGWCDGLGLLFLGMGWHMGTLATSTFLDLGNDSKQDTSSRWSARRNDGATWREEEEQKKGERKDRGASDSRQPQGFVLEGIASFLMHMESLGFISFLFPFGSEFYHGSSSAS